MEISTQVYWVVLLISRPGKGRKGGRFGFKENVSCDVSVYFNGLWGQFLDGMNDPSGAILK